MVILWVKFDSKDWIIGFNLCSIIYLTFSPQQTVCKNCLLQISKTSRFNEWNNRISKITGFNKQNNRISKVTEINKPNKWISQ